jgi:hypothetical protein
VYSQVNGEEFNIMEELTNHCKNNEDMTTEEAYDLTNGKRNPKHTMKEWQICEKWRDGSTSLEDLKELPKQPSML